MPRARSGKATAPDADMLDERFPDRAHRSAALLLVPRAPVHSRGDPKMTLERDLALIDHANASGRTPVVFVHGLWLMPSSWQRWEAVFDDAGYAALAVGWPDDPASVEDAREDPEVFARKSVGDVADYVGSLLARLDTKPAVIGHSFGGLITQILAGRALSAASVAIDPAPFRGVLPLPLSALRSASVVVGNPANRHRAVPLTYEQFRYGFANAVDEDQARRLFEEFAVAASGEPLFQAVAANINPWSETKVRTKAPERGPLLLISGEQDNTVPWALTHAAYQRQRRNEHAVTEVVEVPGRGHALTIDDGWREVADLALAFVQRFVAKQASGETGVVGDTVGGP
jgi:non-heme chloroperoxidase